MDRNAPCLSPKAEIHDRTTLAAWAEDILAPLPRFRSESGSAFLFDAHGAIHSRTVAGMEGFARTLIGLVCIKDRVSQREWEERRRGLCNGVSPESAGFWGFPVHRDQRIVEAADIALALVLAPEYLWTPLASDCRDHVAEYLQRTVACEVYANNWYWFRIMISVALDRLGYPCNRAQLEQDLDRIEAFATNNGWYADGKSGDCDHYSAWAFHYYALLYTALDPLADPARGLRLKQRSVQFAHEYRYWFSAQGAALPFGRSLNYRFAAAAFWGALAYADLEALGWGEIKGLALRHLRWWSQQPFRDINGVIPPGYAYPNGRLVETYASGSSAYWACRSFLPLLLEESHPFWAAAECPQMALAETQPQAGPHLLIQRAESGNHVVAFCAGQAIPPTARRWPEAYSKFCYSSHFGFNLGMGTEGIAAAAHDNGLVLSDDEVYFRRRLGIANAKVGPGLVYFEWRPWQDVVVTTWLIPSGSWHVRIHRIVSPRGLSAVEGGFPLGYEDRIEASSKEGESVARSPNGLSAALNLLGSRSGSTMQGTPNSNLMHPRTAIPTLSSRHAAGTTWLAAAFLGTIDGSLPAAPKILRKAEALAIVSGAGTLLCEIPFP